MKAERDAVDGQSERSVWSGGVDDSKHVIEHQYTPKGRATSSAYTGGDYASK